MAAESSAMKSINMGGLKPSESVVTRRETLADIQAGVKADPRSTTEIIDPDTGEKRLVTKDEALQPEVITEAAPVVKPGWLVPYFKSRKNTSPDGKFIG